MELTVLGILALGFFIGMQHAMEADHVAAVSSMASGQSSVSKIISHGAFWGIGHTATLAAVAGSAIIFGATISDGVAGWLELLVGVMLVALGSHVIWRMVRERVHFHAHTHDDGTHHMHAHSHKGEAKQHDPAEHAHEHPNALPWRPLAVGLMHGLAGSGALVVLTATQITTPLAGFLYVFLFGLGSILGMAILSALIAVPLSYTAKTLTWANWAMRGGIGAVTIVLGGTVIFDNLVRLGL
jgi:ABC-type nickel/cobalt efflux system permease component RcnA